MRIPLTKTALLLVLVSPAICKPAANQPVNKRPSGPPRAKLNPKDGLMYVWIPAGTFQMGCSPEDKECGSDEKPAHRVTITKGFWMGQSEVTVGAYKRFATALGGRLGPPAPKSNSAWRNDTMPMVYVPWDYAKAYCTWAGGRLPTEAEWEYAVRGGSTEARYGPLDRVAWYHANSAGQMHEVAQKSANRFGLFDVLGNVWEWVGDWYDENYYRNSPPQDPGGPASGTERVYRGGSYFSNPDFVRVSVRNREIPAMIDETVGFRCVITSDNW